MWLQASHWFRWKKVTCGFLNYQLNSLWHSRPRIQVLVPTFMGSSRWACLYRRRNSWLHSIKCIFFFVLFFFCDALFAWCRLYIIYVQIVWPDHDANTFEFSKRQWMPWNCRSQLVLFVGPYQVTTTEGCALWSKYLSLWEHFLLSVPLMHLCVSVFY